MPGRPSIDLPNFAYLELTDDSFYRDRNGEATLKDHGFMMEWAKRAGELVFQEAQTLNEDNIVTFCILALFWYTQGSWRQCYLYKGTTFFTANFEQISLLALR